ncbi:hypothetical protein L1987_03860 [Smallanthus sonchifolius]|uniref:Uncharacterized protein n=1 Tax=Smallanthus sonchifolius TaxID=185202 RepID=A0ACB9KBV2_9ASTR|nr:hypothetical protein L1987_03860 [Smallanthus sonchifolius]
MLSNSDAKCGPVKKVFEDKSPYSLRSHQASLSAHPIAKSSIIELTVNTFLNLKMAEGNISEHEIEAMPESYVPVETQVPENENVEEHGDDAVETQDNEEEEQGGDAAEGDAAAAEGVVEDKWPGWPGENVFRLLVPVQKVGVIIGRKGEYIKKTCEETRARIKILDGPPGTTERTVF